MNKQWFRTSNPAMKEEYFTQAASLAGTYTRTMSLEGTMLKTGLLLAITVTTAIAGYTTGNIVLAILAIIVALAASLTCVFKREWSMPLSLVYAVAKGYAVGVISVFYAVEFASTQYKGIVPLALAGTFVVFGAMLALYATRIVKVTQTFRTVVIGATLGAFLFYGGVFLLSFINRDIYSALPVFSSGPIGIGFSLVMIVLAAANFALDFDMIESGVQARAPKYMEWYGAMAVMITLVWLYLEMLRLIAKIARSR